MTVRSLIAGCDLTVLKVRHHAGGHHLADILVVREVTEGRLDVSGIGGASLRLHYECLGGVGDRSLGASGRFVASYCAKQHRVSLTGLEGKAGAVFLDLPFKGQHIGTYLMSSVVAWVKRWPDAAVNPITLLSGQSAHKARRNAFYERYGITFDYADEECLGGVSRPMRVDELRLVESWKRNIDAVPLSDFLATLITKERFARDELDSRDAAVRELLLERRQRERSPLRWALRELLWKARLRLL